MALSESLPELPPNFGDKVETIRKHQKDVATAETEEDLNSAKKFYDDLIDDILDMANGGNGGGIREKFYPDWSDEDFVSLLEEVGEGRRLV